MTFADDLTSRLRRLGHPLCVGLDPHLPFIPPPFRRGTMAPGDPATAAAVEEFLIAVLDRVAGRVAIVKPQIAFFELLGWRGLRALEEVIAAARTRGLLVLLDAKRGDIGSTAEAYAGYLGNGGTAPVDAMTVNPYLGRDTLEPFVERAARSGRGLFVLVKTSNPGSADYQDRTVGDEPLFAAVAASLRDISARLAGPSSAWSSLGVVVGATYPEQSRRVRAHLPNALFLVPGYGAQGGRARDAVAGLARGPEGRLEGGVVSSSRAILFPGETPLPSARAWEAALDEALERSIADLVDATA